jgi:hypothetical protein
MKNVNSVAFKAGEVENQMPSGQSKPIRIRISTVMITNDHSIVATENKFNLNLIISLLTYLVYLVPVGLVSMGKPKTNGLPGKKPFLEAYLNPLMITQYFA